MRSALNSNRRFRLLTDGLWLWAPAAALLGLVFTAAGKHAGGLVPYLLAVMVFATGFTLPPERLAGATRRPGLLMAALLLLFGPLSLLAYLLAQLPISTALSTGVTVLGAAPVEISAGLMVLLAEGDLAFATMFIAASLLLSAVITPLLLTLYSRSSVSINRGDLLRELILSVALPLLAAFMARTVILGYEARAQMSASRSFWGEGEVRMMRSVSIAARIDGVMPATAALAVLTLLFIVAGAAKSLLLSSEFFAAIALCLLLNLAGYAAGWLLFRFLRAQEPVVRAATFTAGMREFGVAATVATAVLPAAAGVAGLYGIIILFTAPALARLWGRPPIPRVD